MLSPQVSLRVLFLASEADPFIKVGGLGDVAGSLPRAIHGIKSAQGEYPWKSIDVRLVIPYHGQISRAKYGLRLVSAFDIAHKNGPLPVEAYDSVVSGLPVYFISGPPILPEAPLYTGDPDTDGSKYTFFSLAALELARSLGWQPHLLHANDWHTAPAIYALSTLLSGDPFYAKTARLLTVHNLPYLGAGTGPALAAFGLPPASDSPLPGWAQDLPLPLGLLTADRIVAVSPTYAREILTPEFGSGLYKFLATRKDAISGILNGIDVDRWNPASDPHLAINFTPENLAARGANKHHLQTEFDLEPEPNQMLFAMINRMDHQKGVDLALEALRMLATGSSATRDPASQKWQAIILGTGMAELEEAAHGMQVEFPGRVRAALRFDGALSSRIYAGADCLLIPSRYEPCGLTQMIAMRYGCVPVARATGGLRDTITDEDQNHNNNGFLFEEAAPEALEACMQRALRAFIDKEKWSKLQYNGMSQDFSWDRSARQYLDLYRTMVLSKQQDII